MQITAQQAQHSAPVVGCCSPQLRIVVSQEVPLAVLLDLGEPAMLALVKTDAVVLQAGRRYRSGAGAVQEH